MPLHRQTMREIRLTWLSSLPHGRELYAINSTNTHTRYEIPIFLPLFTPLLSTSLLLFAKPKLMTTIFGAFSLWWDWFFGFFAVVLVVVKWTFCQAPLSYYTILYIEGKMNVQADLIIYLPQKSIWGVFFCAVFEFSTWL